LLEEFVVYQNGIGFREILIPPDSFLNGVMTDEMDFASLFDILLVGMIDEELGDGFIFITAGVNHKLDSGDTIVCLGEEEKLDAFEILIKYMEMPIDA
jgi:voltage-gated potassium channel